MQQINIKNANIYDNQTVLDEYGDKAKMRMRASRLCFHKDQRISVAIANAWEKTLDTSMSKLGFKSRLIVVNIDNIPVAIKISSLAKRLNITTDKIIAAQSNNKLEELINENVLVRKNILNRYDLFSGEYDKKLNLTKSVIMHIAAVANDQFQGIQTITIPKKLSNVDRKFIIVGNNNTYRFFEITALFNGIILGAGCEGEVTRVMPIGSNAHALAFKRSKYNNSIVELHKEATLTALLNLDGLPHAGIPSTRHLVCMQESKIYGLLMDEVDGDLRSRKLAERNGTQPVTSMLEILQGFNQLLQGASYMHTKGICHGDIKDGNLARTDNMWQFIDFGQATIVNPNDLMSFESDNIILAKCFLEEALHRPDQDGKVIDAVFKPDSCKLIPSEEYVATEMKKRGYPPEITQAALQLLREPTETNAYTLQQLISSSIAKQEPLIV